MVATFRAIITEVCLPVPTFFGNFDDAIPAFAEIAPKGLHGICVWITAAQPDNGNWTGVASWPGDSSIRRPAETAPRMHFCLNLILCARPRISRQQPAMPVGCCKQCR